MSWKCVCKNDNNDEKLKCTNCGRGKPKYLGIKIDLGETEKMNNEQLGLWYLMIAHDHLIDADGYYERLQKFGAAIHASSGIEEINDLVALLTENCQSCLRLLKKSEGYNSEAHFIDEAEVVQAISSVRSECFFRLGSLNFDRRNYPQAIKYYQKSFDSDPNQVSIYNIAMATINLPAEGGGGLFGGKKKKLAQETKREQEIELLKKTIRFAPFSPFGRKSARTLMSDYDMKEILL